MSRDYRGSIVDRGGLSAWISRRGDNAGQQLEEMSRDEREREREREGERELCSLLVELVTGDWWRSVTITNDAYSSGGYARPARHNEVI